MFTLLRTSIAVAAVAVSWLLPHALQAQIAIAPLQRADAVSFEKEILPIFQKNCLACHSESETNGELVLESPQTILRGGDSGPAVEPGKSAASLLLQVASHTSEPVMPPAGNDVAAANLTPNELGLIKLWIDQGAKGSLAGGLLSPTVWRPLPPGNHPIYATAISPDGQFVACGRANQIFIYHAPTGQLISRLSDPALQSARDPRPGAAHLDVVQSLTFNPSGDMLASGGFRTLKLWRFPRDVQRQAAPPAAAALTAVAVSPLRDLAALGSADNSIQLWNLQTGTIQATLTGHTGPVSSLRFSHDGALLYSGSHDQTVRVWQTADGAPAGLIQTPSPVNALTTIQFPSPAAVAAAEQAAAAAAAEPAAPAAEPATAAEEAAEEMIAPAPLPLVEQVVTGGEDKLLRVWEAPLPSAQLTGLIDKTTVLAQSPDRQWLASANAAGQVKLSPAFPPSASEPVDGETPTTPVDPAASVEPAAVLYSQEPWTAHAGPVTALAFHFLPGQPAVEPAAGAAAETGTPAVPARLRLATASADGTVKIWNCADLAAEPLLLRASLSTIASVAFSIDGAVLATGDGAGNVSLWNLSPSPQQAVQNPLPEPAVTPVARLATVSVDGKLLAYATTIQERPAIVVRDLASQQIVHTLLGHTAEIKALAFNADNTRLASGSTDGTARVWSLVDAKFPETATFAEHGAAVTTVAFSSDGVQVVSGAANNTLKAWTAADGLLAADFTGHTGPLVGVFKTATQQIISVAADKTLRVWNPTGGAAVATVALPDTPVTAAMSNDRAQIAVAGAGKNITLHRADTGALVQTLTGHSAVVESLAFSPDQTRLLATDQGAALVWGIVEERLLEWLPAQLKLASGAFLADAQNVVLCEADGRIAAHRLQLERALPSLPAGVVDLVYHPAAASLFAAGEDGSLRSFNTETGALLFGGAHGAPVHALALRGDGVQLATAGEDKVVKIWNPANGAALAPTQLAGFAGPVFDLQFAAGDTQLVGLGAKQMLAFSVVDGALEQAFDLAGDNSKQLLLLDADQLQAAIVNDAGVEVHRLGLVQRITGHTQAITSLTHYQGVEVVSGGADGSVRHWNLQAATPLVRLMNHGGVVTAVAASPESERFASAGEDKTARLWNATSGAQIAILQGDLRADSLVAKLTEQKTAAIAKTAATKAALDVAEKDLPVKVAAEKTRADALAAADKEVAAKMAVVAAAEKAKSAAEQVALQAAAAAQVAAVKKEEIDKTAADLLAAATQLAANATSAQAIAQSEPGNAALTTKAAAAAAAATAADTKAKQAAAAKPAAAQVFQTAATAANTAAAQAVAMNKPYTDAQTALGVAATAREQASQLHAAAQRDLELAQSLPPLAKAELTKAEGALVQAETDLAAAVATAAAAKMPIRAVAFAPQGTSLATAGDYAAVHTWDAEAGQPLGAFVGHAGAVAGIAFESDASLVSVSADKSAVQWELSPGWQLERVIGAVDNPAVFTDRVAATAFSRDGELVAGAGGVPSRSGEFSIFRVSDGSRVQSVFDAHTDAANAIVFSPDSLSVATAAADKYVKIFDIASGQQVRQFEGHTNHVLGVSWRSNGQSLASAGADGVLRVWNAETGDRLRDVNGYTKQVTAVTFVGQSPILLSCSGDGLVRLHNSDNGGLTRNFAGLTDYMYAVDATPNSTLIVAGGHDGVLRIWNGANGVILHEISAPEPPETAAGENPSQESLTQQ
ncbi:WD40 repeat domain-containing protein [Lignipirellula cremea]|uniref:WD domain, G-beta repeat n=1 Tax=Lignipirellula cremea TaxID=2528010 RepID=A0A518DPC0_9BACT|nr:c-type cytochrome domain-containing protein [Lignipirellula cremea]QDU93690.1 WD domain, G-beta repeat [Lignipirellula cremea]